MKSPLIATPAGLLQLYFIRHGQTEWSLSGQHTGRTDIPLTTRGEEEARQLGPRLRTVTFSRILTSPLLRARRTCELAGLEPTVDIEPDLAEWDYGEYEGRTSPEIRKDQPGWNVFRDGCPGGESVAGVTLRADRLITRATALPGNVALFSSGQFGCSLAARWIGLSILQAQHLLMSTASISILAHNPAHPELRVIAHWNHAASDPLGQLAFQEASTLIANQEPDA